MRATKGKNVIISSGCFKSLYHRSPYDIIVLGILFGMSKDKAMKSISKNALECIKKARFRKAYKGTIQMASKEEIKKFREKEE